MTAREMQILTAHLQQAWAGLSLLEDLTPGLPLDDRQRGRVQFLLGGMAEALTEAMDLLPGGAEEETGGD